MEMTPISSENVYLPKWEDCTMWYCSLATMDWRYKGYAYFLFSRFILFFAGWIWVHVYERVVQSI